MEEDKEEEEGKEKKEEKKEETEKKEEKETKKISIYFKIYLSTSKFIYLLLNFYIYF